GHHIRLWVVFVDNFAEMTAEDWAKRTYTTSDLGKYDALLAVATTDRAYAFLVPSVDADQVNALRHIQIEPALRDGNWSGAAIAAADGLNQSPSSWGQLLLL